jgi:hypothetical protein
VKNVDTAMLVDDRVHDLLYRTGIDDITGERRRGAPLPTNDVDRFLCGLAVDIDANDTGAVTGKQDCRRLPVAPPWTDRARTEQDRDLVDETAHGNCSSLCGTAKPCTIRASQGMRSRARNRSQSG